MLVLTYFITALANNNKNLERYFYCKLKISLQEQQKIKQKYFEEYFKFTNTYTQVLATIVKNNAFLQHLLKNETQKNLEFIKELIKVDKKLFNMLKDKEHISFLIQQTDTKQLEKSELTIIKKEEIKEEQELKKAFEQKKEIKKEKKLDIDIKTKTITKTKKTRKRNFEMTF